MQKHGLYSKKMVCILSLIFGWGFCAAGDGEPTTEVHMAPLSIKDVKVGGEIGRRIDVTINNNLMVLDLEKHFLKDFKSHARKGGYVGLGKLIDAAVRLAAYSGDAKVVERKNLIVDETLKTQADDGYIGIVEESRRVSALWDVSEMGYLVYGLVSDYEYFGQQKSLDAAKKLTDYLIVNWPKLPPDWAAADKVAGDLAAVGLERALVALYRVTKDQRYRDFLVNQRKLIDWNLPIVLGRRPMLEGHAYGYLARCLAQLDFNELEPGEKLFDQTNRTLTFMLRNDGTTITGACGQNETWHDDQDGRGELGETCTTAYQLRVYDRMLRIRGEAIFGDLIERTIYNTLFAAQSPDGRQIRYYTPFEGKREYFDKDSYCCPNNYRRIIADLPAMIYYQCNGGLTVNLYTESSASLTVGNNVKLTVWQETKYPTDGHIVIRLDPAEPTRFPLRLRIPGWCPEPNITINGELSVAPAVGGTLCTLTRDWHAGDTVTLELPMHWRLIQGRQRQAGRVAVMRGPVIFCLNPAQNEKAKKLDSADLGRIMIDPTSLQEPQNDDTVRPGGLACSLNAWSPGANNSHYEPDMQFKLTEFPDPAGQVIYFRTPDPDTGQNDELFD